MIKDCLSTFAELRVSRIYEDDSGAIRGVHVVVSVNRGPQYRPPNIKNRYDQKGTLNFGKP